MQPAWTQVPPTRPRSTRTTSAPARLPASAAATPPGPAPTTTRSAIADRRLQRRPDVDHPRAGQGDRRRRVAVGGDGQLALAVERDRTGAAAEPDRLAELEEPPAADRDPGHHPGRDRGGHGRPVAELDIEARGLVRGHWPPMADSPTDQGAALASTSARMRRTSQTARLPTNGSVQAAASTSAKSAAPSTRTSTRFVRLTAR